MRMLNMTTLNVTTTSFGEISLFERINKIELNYNVSMVLFAKYKYLFTHLIADIDNHQLFYSDETNNDDDDDDDLRHKHKKLCINSNEILDDNDESSGSLITNDDLFKFGWSFFIYIKGKKRDLFFFYFENVHLYIFFPVLKRKISSCKQRFGQLIPFTRLHSKSSLY
jgi:hypothetical protein